VPVADGFTNLLGEHRDAPQRGRGSRAQGREFTGSGVHKGVRVLRSRADEQRAGAPRAPAVIARKLSFGSESPPGSRFVERMLTAIGTLKQQDRNVLDYMVAAHEPAFTVSPRPRSCRQPADHQATAEREARSRGPSP
jgi:hypothetical protein